MCDHKGSPGVPLTFEQLAAFLREPPHEPCESELQFLTPAQYALVFTQAVDRYYHKIRGHIAHITKDYDLATDLAQVVFLRLYQARASFDGPYIYRAAKNAAYSALLRDRRRRALESRWAGVGRHYEGKGGRAREPHDPHPLQDAELFERARTEAVRAAVERLPERFREALILYAAGHSYEQITEITGTNVGTARSRVCRGKALLRRKLSRYL